GMVFVASGLVAGYYVIGSKGEARAATPVVDTPQAKGAVTPVLQKLASREVAVKTTSGAVTLHWAHLGVQIDPDQVHGPVATDADVTALATKAALPVKLDRTKAVAKLMELKRSHDTSPLNAWLDLEEKKIHDDIPGQGIDVWASLSRIEAGARQAS